MPDPLTDRELAEIRDHARTDIPRLLAEVDRLRELVMRPLSFHTCPDGKVQSYPSLLCSRHPGGCENFDPRAEIERLRSENEALKRDSRVMPPIQSEFLGLPTDEEGTKP